MLARFSYFNLDETEKDSPRRHGAESAFAMLDGEPAGFILNEVLYDISAFQKPLSSLCLRVCHGGTFQWVHSYSHFPFRVGR